MLILITPQNYHLHREDLDDMYRLRSKSGQAIQHINRYVHAAHTKDEYDEKNAYYLVYKDEEKKIRGCLRFIEMIHDCMLDSFYGSALPNAHEFKRPNYWEVTQLMLEGEQQTKDHTQLSKEIDVSLLAGYTLFGLEFDSECSLFIANTSLIKRYETYGLFLAHLNEARINNEEISIALFSPLHYYYDKLILQTHLDVSKPILWNNCGWYKKPYFMN